MRNGFQPNDNIQQIAKAYATEAVRFAKDKLGIELDWSDESVFHIETILSLLHNDLQQAKPTEEMIYLYAKTFGSYVGEVFRKNYKATWGMVTFQGNRYPGLQATGSDSTFGPWKHAHYRIINGPEYNIWHQYKILIAGGSVVASKKLPTAAVLPKKSWLMRLIG